MVMHDSEECIVAEVVLQFQAKDQLELIAEVTMQVLVQVSPCLQHDQGRPGHGLA